MKKILVIDNYDSFTFNLVHYLEDLDCEVTVLRNDKFDLEDIQHFDKIVLSPGPGIPEDIINKIGEPYIKSKSKELSSKSGLGLGSFLGKTLLERQNAKLLFRRNGELGGALAIISWNPKVLTNA